DINGLLCAQVKTEQYQVRGTRVKPYWTHAIHGGREIRRRQGADGMRAIEKPSLPLHWSSKLMGQLTVSINNIGLERKNAHMA
ncbi:unnamed protein product, partial [Strongylus vulgaris]